jgi:hypothetical protein
VSAAAARKTTREIERHYFERFCKAYALPAGSVTYGDKPDVTLTGSGQSASRSPASTFGQATPRAASSDNGLCAMPLCRRRRLSIAPTAAKGSN